MQSGQLVEHTLKITREIDSRSPSFMSSALQGTEADQVNLAFELVATVLPTENLTIRYERFEQRTVNPPASFCWDFTAQDVCP